MKTRLKTNRGFTLIELVVSVGIFSMVFVSVMGAFVSVMDAYQKVTATRTNVDNLTTALESMTRGAKTGTKYHCGTGDFTTALDCPGGDTIFAFTNKNIPRPFSNDPSQPIVYKFVPCPNVDKYCGRIQRSDDNGNIGTFYPVTAAPPTLDITYARFYVFGSAPFPDTAQPQAVIVMKGNVGVKNSIAVPFSIQTTLTQRSLDVTVGGASKDVDIPTIPADLLASVATASSVTLTWTPSTDAVGVVGYKIYRCVGVACSSFVLTNVSAGSPFVDSGLTAATTYGYKILAYDTGGNESGLSTGITKTTLAGADITPPTVSVSAPTSGATVSGASVVVSANASDAVGVVGVQFKLDGVNLSSEDLTSPYSITWNSTTASNGGHLLTAVARDAAGNTATSPGIAVTVNNVAVDTTPPTTPGTPTTSSITSSSMNVAWTPSTDAVGVTGYNIFRCAGAGCTPVSYGTSVTNAYSDSGLSASTLYRYTISAYDAAGNNSTASGIGQGTTLASGGSDITTGLIARWKFDETSGTSCADSAGTRTGTAGVGATIDSSTKKIGTAARVFNGASAAKITIPVLTTGTTFTFTAWVKPPSSGSGNGFQALLGDDTSSGNNSIYYAGGSAGTRKINYYNGTSHISATALTAGSWNHVAFVVTAGAGKFYINGVLDGSSFGGVVSYDAFYLGGDYASEQFIGSLDDVRFYNRALTQADITALYNFVGP